MKKTLLSVALAGLTLTAFANTNLYSSDTTKVYVDGHLRVLGSVNQVKTTVNKTKVSGETATLDKSEGEGKFLAQENRFRLGLGTSYNNADGLTLGLYTRATVNLNAFKLLGDSDSKLEYSKDSFKNVKPERYFFWLGSKELGKATVGKTTTVADSRFGSDSVVMGYVTGNRQTTSFDRSYKWEAPKVGSFQFNYSFANQSDKPGVKYQRQNAYTGTYDLGMVAVTGYAAWDNRYNVAGNLFNKTKSFELSANTNLAGVKVSGAVVYDKVTQYDGSVLEKVTASSVNNGFAVKSSYVVNQFFKPYAGVAYVKGNDKKFDGTETVSRKSLSAYVGFGSDLYKSSSVQVATFAEVGFEQAKVTSKTYALNKPTGSTEAKSNKLGVAFGGQVSF